MKPQRQLDEIDLWADRTFGHARMSRRIELRRGLEREGDKKKFDSLFRKERNDARTSEACLEDTPR